MHEVQANHFHEVVNIEQVISQSSSRSLQQFYQGCQSQELIHSGMMKAEGTVYSNDQETWIHTKATPESKGQYLFHPTLLDGSAIGCGELFAKLASGEKRLFLPLFYESFTACKVLDQECYTRIKHSSMEAKQELIVITMEFFDVQGNKVAELKNFKNKLVRDAGLINPNRKQDQQAKPGQNKATISAEQQHSFDSIDSMLQSLIAAKLGVGAEQVALDQGYYELGLDSAMLLEVVQAMESILGESLPPTLLFEYPNIAALSQHLSQLHQLPDTKIEFQKTSRFIKHNKVKATTTHTPLAQPSIGNTPPAILDIAVIGMAGRYPQADDLHEFWENLKAEKDCITQVPKDRWDISYFDGMESPSGKTMSKWGGFVNDVDCFDAQFFRVSPREAKLLDPQERMFIEICWEAMEDAGYCPDNIVVPEGKNQTRAVGVFVGVMHKDYAFLQHEVVKQGQHISLSLNYAPIANRVSYFCNFHGPSMAVDTVCSSSLTAVHLAMESLTKGGKQSCFCRWRQPISAS